MERTTPRLTDGDSSHVQSNGERCIHELIKDTAIKQPQAQAINAWDGMFTYRGLDDLSDAFARYLRKKGVGCEVLVPICLEKSRWVPLAMLGVLKAGGAFVLMDPSHPLQRMQQICKAVGAQYVITSKTQQSRLGELGGEIILAADVMEKSSHLSDTEEVLVKPTNAAYVMFTSGSSGVPKGVVVEHRSFCTSALAHSGAIELNSNARVLQFSSFAFDVSLTEILSTLIVGGCVCVPSDADRKENLAVATRTLGATYAILTPSLARVIEVEDFTCLETLVLAGEAVHREDVEKWVTRVKLYGAYGPTEAAVLSAVQRFEPNQDHVDANNIGHGVGVTCWVVDQEDHNVLLQPGNLGELLLDGIPIAREYINSYEQTRNSFIQPPEWHRNLRPFTKTRLYKTGDLVIQDAADASIRYIGRKDNQVKVNGQRTELGEIEAHIRNTFKEARNVVVELAEIARKKELVAFVLVGSNENSNHNLPNTLNKSSWLSPNTEQYQEQVQGVVGRLNETLPRHMIPALFLPVRSIPLMASGKSDRRMLRSLCADIGWDDLEHYRRNPPSTAKTMPTKAGEINLQRLWAEVLGIPIYSIGLEDSFQHIGGDSLAAIKLAGLARRNGLSLSVSQIYKHQTLSSMALEAISYSSHDNSGVEPFSLLKLPDQKDTLIEVAVQQCQLVEEAQIEDIYPCSPLQAGLIALTAKIKTSGIYDVHYEYKLPEDVNISQFRSAWTTVLRANPILRTRIIQARSGAMYQVVLTEHSSWKDEISSDKNITDWKLGQPLTRFYLQDHEKRMILCLHHAITDGWSLPLLLEQVQSAYHGKSLKPCAFNQFIQYTINLDQQKCSTFWKQTCQEFSADTYPVVPSLDYVANPSMKKSRVAQSGALHGVYTISNRLKLAWALLICRYTKNPDVVFGTIVNGRNASVRGIEEVTGPTIATVPIRIILKPHDTVEEQLQHIQNAYVEMIPYEQTGLQNVRRLSVETEKACQFQSLLVIQPEEKQLPTLFADCTDLSEQSAFAAYPLTLQCQSYGATIDIEATFDPTILDPMIVDQLLLDLTRIFECMVEGSRHQRLEEFDVALGQQWPAPKVAINQKSTSCQSTTRTMPDRVKPITDVEHSLLKIFADTINATSEEICIHDNFFRLGGDSILAMRLVTCAKDQNLIFSVADIFSAPTIALLAKRVQILDSLQEVQISPFSLLPDPLDLEELMQCAISQCQIDRADIEDMYPCSGLQEGLMALTVKNPGTYVARFEYMLSRHVDVRRFQKAWNAVYAANSILRTRIFQSPKHGTLQVVLKDSLKWDICKSTDQGSDDVVSSMALGSPLLQTTLTSPTRKQGCPRFVCRMHHSLYDGWSLPLLWQQVNSAYEGKRLQPQPYNRFIRYLVENDGGNDFWRSELADLNAEIFPPLREPDYIPNPKNSFNHTITDLPVQRASYTISTVLQLAWALVISHYTDSDDVVFGLTLNGRTASVLGIDEITGPTIATVPLRIRLDNQRTIAQVMTDLQKKSAQMIPFLHQGLQQIQKLSPDAAKACQFQSHLGIQPSGIMAEETLGWLEKLDQEDVQSYDGFVSYAYTMICHLTEDSTSIRVAVNHDTFVLEEIEARRLVQQFEGVVRQIITSPDVLLSKVEVISEQDMSTLSEWNGCVPAGTEKTLHEMVLRYSSESPYADAVCAFDGELNYQQLDELSGKLANRLVLEAISSIADNATSDLPSQHKRKPSKQYSSAPPAFRIAVCLEKSKWSIVALLAVLRAGAACVLLDPNHPRLRLKQLLQKTKPQFIVTSEITKDHLKGLGTKVIALDAVFIQHVEQSQLRTLPMVDPSHAAFILFTSGSTGKSKAVIMEHINLSTSISAHSGALGLVPSSRCLHFASYAFDASIYEIFDTLCCGGCICIPSEYDRLNDLAGVMNDLRINFAILTPSTINLLQPIQVPGLRTLVTAGEPMTRTLLETWCSQVTLINAYGPLEATCCSVFQIPPIANTGNTATIGRTLGCVGWIVSPSNPNKLAAIGSVGELILEGSVVSRGYLDDSEKTASAYIDQPPWLRRFRSTYQNPGASRRLYRSGDLVSYNPDGTIRYVGRKDTQVKLRGQRIELGEIEYRVRNCWPTPVAVVAEVVCPSRGAGAPGLIAFVWDENKKQTHAKGILNDDIGEIFALPEIEFQVASQEAENCLQATCPAFMVPSLFLSLRYVPLTQTGKIDRKRLRELCGILLSDHIQRYTGSTRLRRSPSTRIERILHDIWSQVLKLKPNDFGISDSFFRIGGDSISAMQVVSQCAASKMRLSVAIIFAHKTIAEISKHVQDVAPLKSPAEDTINNDPKIVQVRIGRVQTGSFMALEVYRLALTKRCPSGRHLFEKENGQVTYIGKVQPDESQPILRLSAGPIDAEFELHRIKGHFEVDESISQSDSYAMVNGSADNSLHHLIQLSQHESEDVEYYLAPSQHGIEFEDAYPCSPIQDGILVSQAKDSTQYHNTWSWSVRSKHDNQICPERLIKAWRRVVQKHPILRSIFVPSHSGKGSLYNQLVLKNARNDSFVLLPESNVALAQNLKLKPLAPLDEGTPQHRLIIQKSTLGHVECLLEISHTLIDGISTQLLLDDLRCAYDDKLDPLHGNGYKNYVKFIREQQLDESRNFWKTILQNAEPCILPNLTTDVTIVHEQKTLLSKVQFARELREFCAEFELTLAGIFQLAWSLVLQTYLNEATSCFGYITSGRDGPTAEIDRTVGPFINMLICNVIPQDGESVLALLRRNQVLYVESLEHQYLSVAEKIKYSRIPHARLFNTIMSIMKGSSQPIVPTTLEFDDFGGDAPTEYDMTVNIELIDSQINVAFEYCTSFLSEDFAQVIADAFQQALLCIISDYDKQPCQLDILGPISKQHIIAYNSAPLVSVERCLHDVIKQRCDSQPFAQAVCAHDGNFTYAEIDKISSALSRQLVLDGVGADVFVPVCFEKSKWTVIALLAIMKAGGAFVLLDVSFPLLRLQAICENLKAPVILTSRLNQNLAESLLSNVIVVSSDSINWSMRTSFVEQTEQASVPSKALYAVFTSGSTGTPKGAVVEHRSFLASATAHSAVHEMNASSRVLQYTSYAWDVNIVEHFSTLMSGGCICVPSEAERKEDYANMVSKYKVNWAFLTPSMARIMEPSRFPSLRTLVIGGDAVGTKEVQLWHKHVSLYSIYGPTETSVFCSTTDRMQTDSDGRNLGRFLGSHSWIVDPDNSDKLLPVGAIGELLIEGPIVGRGYLNNRSQTNLVFISTPTWRSDFPGDSTYKFYRTGDLVRYSKEGVQFVGRKDFQTKIRGQRLELGEIIQHLRSVYPFEEDIVVDIIKTENGTTKLVAFICSTHTKVASEFNGMLLPPSDEFLDRAQKAECQLSARIPVFMIPSFFLPLRFVPRTPQEKIDRKKLRETVLSLSEAELESYSHFGTSKLQPSNEIEGLIQMTWAQVLNKSQISIGINESFFRLGGDSITAMQVSSKLFSAGLSVTVAEIFRQKTIAQIALVVKKAVAVAVKDDTEGSSFQLSPIQKFFFHLSPDGCNHFNQDFFLKVINPITSDKIRDALQHIVKRHSMLRARFIQDNGGHWTQVIRPFSSDAYHYQEYLLQSILEADPIMTMIHKSLDIKQGPLFSAAVFNVENDKFLFLGAHHLVVDLVSWRTILEDLEILLRTDTIPDASSVSFQSWCESQGDYAVAKLIPEMAHEAVRLTPPVNDYWGLAGYSNKFSDTVELGFVLDAQTSSTLFQEANQAFATEPLELLQAGILHAFAHTFKDRSTPALWNESHGRESWDSQLDVSRTVGWFTTLWPLQLEDSNYDLVEMIKHVKDERRRIPSNGWKFFTALMLAGKDISNCEVLFNYVGRYQQLETSDALFRPIPRSAATDAAGVGRAMPRFAIIEISVFHKDDCIQFVFSCNKHAIDNRPIRTWVAACERSLRSITTELPKLYKGFTLSDFPLIPFTYGSLKYFENNTLQECGLSSADIEDIYPCSPIQRGMLLSQAKSDQTLYVHLVIWKIRFNKLPLALEKVIQAWRKIVSRHSILRTVFVKSVVDSNYLDQVVLKLPTPEIHTVEPNDEQILVDILFKQRQLECSTGSLPYRFTAGQTFEGDVLCALEMSHTLFDGTTTQILQRELHQACEGTLVDRPSVPYKDYISYLATRSQTASMQHWSRYVEGIIPCVIPTKSRTLESTLSDEKVKAIDVKMGSAADLREFCNLHQLTLSNLFQLAWGIVLKSFVGSQSVCFGFLNSGRDIPLSGIEDAVGPFINILLCHMDLEDNKLIMDTLLANQSAYINNIEHQHVPLTDLLRYAKVQNKGRLFNTLVSLQTSRDTSLESSDTTIEIVSGQQVRTEYDLTLHIVARPDECWTKLTYFESIIDSELVESIADTLFQVIREVIRKPSESIAQIRTLGERGRQMIQKWNFKAPPLYQDRVDDLIHQQCTRTPNAQAICSFDGEFTYQRLDQLSTSLANLLNTQHAVGRGTFVALCFEKSRWTPVAMYGVIKAGAAFILLDPSYPVPRLQEICQSAGCSVVVTSESQQDITTKLHKHRSIVVGNNMQFCMNQSGQRDHVRVSPNPSSSDALYATFTSGSTGTPKGIIIEHQAFVTSAIGQMENLNIQNSTRVLQYSSYAFDVAIADILVTLMAGGCVCIPSDIERKDLTALPAAVTQLGANWAYLTFTVAKLLNPRDYPSLQTVLVGGEQVSEKDLHSWHTYCKVHFSYGPAEASVHCASNSDVTILTSGRNFGKPYSCRMWIVDQYNDQNLAPIGSVGELVIEGHLLAREYLNDPTKTDAVFMKHAEWLNELDFAYSAPIYKTGDLVKYDESNDGSLYFIGRKDTQVKFRGQRLETGEVERHLIDAFPGIKDLVVSIVNYKDPKREPALVAFICTTQVHNVSQSNSLFDEPSDAFRSAVLSTVSAVDKILPLWMVPTVFIPIQSIPLTRTGKTDRRKLSDFAASLTSEELSLFNITATSKRLPSNAKESLFLQIFAKLFGLEPTSIGMDDHFFRLGGDSVIAMKLIPLAREYGYGIYIADVFNHPKLCDLISVARTVDFSITPESMAIAPFSLLDDKEDLSQLAARQCQIALEQIEDIYPSSPLQEGLIALSLKSTGQYVATFEYDVIPSIDPHLLANAWIETSKANPILRTRFIAYGSEVVQVVATELPKFLFYDNYSDYKERRCSLKIAMGKPLVQFEMIKANDSPSSAPRFYLTIHHSLYDSVSLPLLWKQVEEAYSNKPLPYRCFSYFIRETLPTEDSRRFWSKELAGCSAPVFPVSSSRRITPSPTSSMTHMIENLQLSSIKFTASTLIRFAWAIIVSAYTDSNEVVFGVTTNGRDVSLHGIDQITGPTITSFPLRIVIEPHESIEAQLASLQQKMVSTIPYQHFGLQNIRKLGEDSVTACNFQFHLGVQAPREQAEASMLYDNASSKHEDYGAFANYSLVIVCHLPEKGAKDLIIAASFDERVLETSEVKRMMHQFEGVLRQLCDSRIETSTLTCLNLVCPEDEAQIVEWNSKETIAADACLHDLVLQHAANQPNAAAICSWDGDLTYYELKEECDALTAYLQALGVKRGQSVPLFLERSKWAVVAMIAVLQLGANCVCLDPDHPKDRVQAIIERTEAHFVLTSLTTREKLDNCSNCVALTIPITEDFEAIAEPAALTSIDDIAFIVFTSGSTGIPKGVLLEHVNLATSIQSYSAQMHISQDTRGLHFASYAFDASIYEIFGALINGGTLCIPSEYDKMNDIALFINEYKVNWMFFTPSAISLLKPEDVPGVRTVVLGGEAVTQDNVRIWASKVNLVNGYGPAESTVCAVGQLPPSGWKQGTIGHLSGGFGWITMPNDASRLAPIGAVGELLIQGPVVSRGYLNDATNTSKSFSENAPWLRKFQPHSRYSRIYQSGDLFQYAADGSVRYLGRKDTQVKLRGQRIELHEVESKLKQVLPSFADIVAEIVTGCGSPSIYAFLASASKTNEVHDNLIEGIFSPRDDQFLHLTSLATKKIRQQLPDYMVPSLFIQMPTVPLTASGKIDRKKLRECAAKLSREQIREFTSVTTSIREAKTDKEILIRSLWSQVFVLPAKDIGLDDDFFNLGGDSISAMRLAALARQHGVQLDSSIIFKYPTLNEQVEQVKDIPDDSPTEQYRPGSLLGLTDVVTTGRKLLAGRCSPSTYDTVADILPITQFQHAILETNTTTYSRLRISMKVDENKILQACRALLKKYPPLRSVFTPYKGQWCQILFSEMHFDLMKHTCSEDILGFSRDLCFKDSQSKVADGHPHFQPFLISQSEKEHIFLLRMTHAAYDGVSLPMIWEDFISAYNGHELATPNLSLSRYLLFKIAQSNEANFSFWRQYLHGSSMINSRALDIHPNIEPEDDVRVKSYKHISTPPTPSGITLASLARAAWSLVLSKRTKSRDVVFGNIVNGRDVPLPGIERFPSPTVTISPFRATIQDQWTVADLLDHVQAQLSSAMPYASLDFQDILANATSWPSATGFGCILTHQSVNDYPTYKIDGTDAPWDMLEFRVPSDIHVVTWCRDEKFFVFISGSSKMIRQQAADEIIDELCETLRFLAADGQAVLL